MKEKSIWSPNKNERKAKWFDIFALYSPLIGDHSKRLDQIQLLFR